MEENSDKLDLLKKTLKLTYQSRDTQEIKKAEESLNELSEHLEFFILLAKIITEEHGDSSKPQ